jgi:Mn2+/Fe2+ NRAMP family transporter
VWTAVFALVAGGLIYLPALYAKLERLVKVVVGAMLVTFAGTLAMIGVRPRDAAAGLLPGFPDTASVFLSLGILATTFSIVAAVYQGYLVREKGLGAEDLAEQGVDSALGIGVLGTISIVVLLTSAGAIRAAGRPLLSAQEMALQLEPLAGPLAFHLFTLGFFFAAFSSLVINPLVGATLLADSFGADPSMDGRPVKRGSTVILLLGATPVLVFSGSPIALLRAAQALAVVALPVLGYFVLRLSRDPALMGRHAAAASPPPSPSSATWPSWGSR